MNVTSSRSSALSFSERRRSFYILRGGNRSGLSVHRINTMAIMSPIIWQQSVLTHAAAGLDLACDKPQQEL